MLIRELTLDSILPRLMAAILAGGLIGLERGMKNRPAGMRTYMLVSIGACLVVMTNQYIYQITGIGDPARMGAQVVNGIGFLGGGTIIATRSNQIKGLTTAAGLWASAGAGLAFGLGFYECGLLASLGILIILKVLQRWDSRILKNARSCQIYFELEQSLTLEALLRELRPLGLSLSNVQTDSDKTSDKGFKSYVALLRFENQENCENIHHVLGRLDGVRCVEKI